MKAPHEWSSLGPWGLAEVFGWIVLGGVTVAVLVLQPLVWKIAFGVLLGELGLVGLRHASGRYREFRAGLKPAAAAGVGKQE